jgi:hypothetical protein
MDTQKAMQEAKNRLITRIVADHIGWGFGWKYADDKAHKVVEKMSHEEIMNCLTNGEAA